MKSSDNLFQLIKALTKGDRRNFKLFAKLQEGNKNYIQLFDSISKQDKYDEKKLLEQFEGEKFTRQFSVAKNYLYNYILRTLHVFHKDTYSELNTLLHQIRILISKNLHEQAQKLIRKAHHLAEKQERFQEQIYLYQYERIAMGRTDKDKEFDLFIGEIQRKERLALERLTNMIEYHQLYDEMHSLKIRTRTARLQDEKEKLDAIIQNPLLANPDQALSLRAKLKRLSILNDCHYFQYNLEECISISEEIINIYESSDHLRMDENYRYINSLSNYAAYGIIIKNRDSIQKGLAKLKAAKTGNQSEENHIFETYYALQLSYFLDEGIQDEGIKLIEELEGRMKTLEGKIRKSIELTLHWLCTYFWLQNGYPSQALKWVNKILNEPKTELRVDLQCMARLVNLLIHFELGNRDTLEYSIKSSGRFIAKRNRMFNYEKTTLSYLSQLGDAYRKEDQENILLEFFAALQKIEQDEIEKRAFFLFDMKTWVEARLRKSSMTALVRERLGKKEEVTQPTNKDQS